MKALHVQFQALTSTYKIPFINTGIMITSPVPSYSSIVGLISCCKGEWIKKDETLIGFKYSYQGVGRDLETTQRFAVDSKGNLKKNAETGIATREFHVNPTLDLYLTNTNLKPYFIKPIGVPVLGRSQDIAWITKVEGIQIESAEEGRIKPTLIPFPCDCIGGRMLRLCDYFKNDICGCVREPEEMILYQIVPVSEQGIYIKRKNLYRINKEKDEVIYMHKLGDES